MRVYNENGFIDLDAEVFTAISGCAAINCFGVKGMAVRTMVDGIVHLLKREAISKGVKVLFGEDGELNIELHIIVEHGVNITALCRSIISEVSYNVSRLTGVNVKSVNVCVDSITVD